jgi:energy-coupling factor transport system permease protein
MQDRRSLHALTWAVWAVCAAACVELAPSPVYVALVLAVCGVVVAAHGGDSALARAFPLLVAVGVSFGLVRIALAVATTHAGTDVLFSTPAFTLPRILGGFTVGGTVELPVLLQVSAEAFAVVGIMGVFGAFNAVVSHAELVQSSPRAFYEPGLVVTVALAFVPSTIATIQRVREADRARTGGTVHRRGRMLRLLVPVLENGMEQAMALAESMDARGFASAPARPQERAAGWSIVVALVALGGAFVALVGRANAAAVVLAVVAVGALLFAIGVASRAATRPRYRRRPVTRVDRVTAATVLLAPVGLALLALAGEPTLAWTAAPLRTPGFEPLAALAIAALAVPAVRAA